MTYGVWSVSRTAARTGDADRPSPEGCSRGTRRVPGSRSQGSTRSRRHAATRQGEWRPRCRNAVCIRRRGGLEAGSGRTGRRQGPASSPRNWRQRDSSTSLRCARVREGQEQGLAVGSERGGCARSPDGRTSNTSLAGSLRGAPMKSRAPASSRATRWPLKSTDRSAGTNDRPAFNGAPARPNVPQDAGSRMRLRGAASGPKSGSIVESPAGLPGGVTGCPQRSFDDAPGVCSRTLSSVRVDSDGLRMLDHHQYETVPPLHVLLKDHGMKGSDESVMVGNPTQVTVPLAFSKRPVLWHATSFRR